jgi:hypothetical protein
MRRLLSRALFAAVPPELQADELWLRMLPLLLLRGCHE